MGDKLREVAEQAEGQQQGQNDGCNHPAPAFARPGRRRGSDDRRRGQRWRQEFRRMGGCFHNARKLAQSGQGGKCVIGKSSYYLYFPAKHVGGKHPRRLKYFSPEAGNLADGLRDLRKHPQRKVAPFGANPRPRGGINLHERNLRAAGFEFL